ncbi:UNVERIFIED_CONTAM: hypothetical protein Slati_3869100 [Sesamum latifolium]|uniref:Uncharacterized protein n=1 Tax=Sesamum latifolium TaxID=2727402 RepID=A0AAW2TLQ6_9LAMI
MSPNPHAIQALFDNDARPEKKGSNSCAMAEAATVMSCPSLELSRVEGSLDSSTARDNDPRT